MNEIVTKFIEEQKKKEQENRKKKKEQHLLDLGIVDYSDSPQKYCSQNLLDWQRKEYGYIHQDEKGFFKYENVKPLEVSDEDYEELCKVCPPKIHNNKDAETKLESNKFAENVVSSLA